MPESGDRLLSLAPLLPFYDLDPNRFRYLGITAWSDPRVAREPALIGGWYAGPAPETPERVRFVRVAREAYGRDMPPIAALGYDAVALAAALARRGDVGVAALTHPDGFLGVDGLFRLREDGTNDRRLAIMQVQRGTPRVLEPAAERFVDLTE
jgi:hypothetical protein